METIQKKILDYQNGDENAGLQVIQQMTPLLENYAFKIHFLPHEDAIQEMYLALLNALHSINITQTEAQCIAYITTTIKNHYSRLCIKHLPYNASISLYDSGTLFDLIEKNSNVNSSENQILAELTIYDFIQGQKNQNIKSILILSALHYNTREIADHLHLSRQYVNRTKKSCFSQYNNP